MLYRALVILLLFYSVIIGRHVINESVFVVPAGGQSICIDNYVDTCWNFWEYAWNSCTSVSLIKFNIMLVCSDCYLWYSVSLCIIPCSFVIKTSVEVQYRKIICIVSLQNMASWITIGHYERKLYDSG